MFTPPLPFPSTFAALAVTALLQVLPLWDAVLLTARTNHSVSTALQCTARLVTEKKNEVTEVNTLSFCF